MSSTVYKNSPFPFDLFPNEIKGKILSSVPFTPSEVGNILGTNTSLNLLAHENLPYIASGSNSIFSPLNISTLKQFERIERIEHPIEIKTIQDLEEVSALPYLIEAVLDLNYLYRHLDLNPLDEVLLFFIRNYKETHTHEQFIRSKFKFLIWPFADITYSPNSLSIIHHNIIPSQEVWMHDRFVVELDFIHPISSFTGWPQEAFIFTRIIELQELIILLDDRAFTHYRIPNDMDKVKYSAVITKELLDEMESLKYVTIDTQELGEESPLYEFWIGEKFIHYLDRIYPNILRFNYPVSVWQLIKWKEIFPNADWPIIRDITSNREVDLLIKSSDMFTGFQLLPEGQYPEVLPVNTIMFKLD